jgi:hypothetical protein
VLTVGSDQNGWVGNSTIGGWIKVRMLALFRFSRDGFLFTSIIKNSRYHR